MEQEIKTNVILQGDCLELFKTIPDNSIDMCFADPPFNLKKRYTSYTDNLDLQEYLLWCKKWIAEMVRVTKQTGSIFVHNIPKWLTFYASYLNDKAHFRHWISWEAPTAPMGKTLQPVHYGILFYTKEQKNSKIYEIRHPHKRDRKQGYLLKDYGGKKDILHPFGPLISDVWTDIHRIRHNKNRDEHPCQLPVHLLERLILLATDENDTVLDPFSGTGTTGVAAKQLGRKYIGFELDEQYVNISQKKLENTVINPKVGDSFVSWYLSEIVTLREIDWNDIRQYFIIPDSIRKIDSEKIVLKAKLKPNKVAVNYNENYEITLFEQKTVRVNELPTV
ncbi:DNA-methyltransferase [Treponema endosymbiont of Eucomonympha sp.]|uniref:DNA-methyltransferase n=1 Tax=Treponema endosymbiont of Eucomonympha sp. TaxID=1580831 RepID=UPI00078605A6|nr:site-specific DNA-methyltransferase [Treponema endosymbiont of Eucomonympha sp.]